MSSISTCIRPALVVWVFWSFCLAGSSVFAQDNDPLAGKDSLVFENERIEDIIESDKPNMKPPVEKTEAPKTDDIRFRAKDYFVDTDYKPDDPSPRDVSIASQTGEGYRNMVRAGLGRFITPLFQLYLNSKTSEIWDYGLDFTHHSASNDNVEYRRFRRDYGTVRGSYKIDDHKIYGNFHVFNTNYFNYGDTLPRVSEAALEDDIRMNYTKVDFKGGVARQYDYDVPYSYDGSVRLQFYNDRRENAEFHFTLAPKGKLFIDDQFTVDLETELTLSRARINFNIQNRVFTELTPLIHYNNGAIRLRGGFRWNVYNNSVDTEGISRLAPVVEARIEIFPDELALLLGYDGRLHYNTYDKMIEENPYMSQAVDILPTFEKINVYGGVQGKLLNFIDFSARAYFKRLENALVYTAPTNNTVVSDDFYFLAEYDTVDIVGIHGEINYDKDGPVKAGAAITFNVYDNQRLSKYFHATPIRLDGYATYVWEENLSVTGQANFYSPTTVAEDENGESIKRNAFLNLSFLADYQIIERFSVYLYLNNLLGGKFQRWYNYPERPIDFGGGLTFLF